MQQLDLLWKYQQADMDVVRYETEMRQFPMRQKLIKLRNLVADQQTLVKGMENDAAAALERLENMRTQHDKLVSDCAQIRQALEKEDGFTSAQQVRSALNQLQDADNKLHSYEKDLAHMVRDSQHVGARYKDIRQKVIKARDEYTKLKAVYDVEYAKQSEKLTALRAVRDEAAKGLEQAYLDRYNAIRSQRMPPMAKLVNSDQCGGCNMSLPAVVMQNIRNKDRIIECENCGRILYIED